MKNKVTLFLGLLILFVFSAFAKDDPITELLKKLEEFTKKYPQEKIHLHLDKPYYAIGDDIWFNAYVINTKTGTPTQISNIIYIELINERDSLIKQLKIPMKSGIAWGDFKLTDNLNDGNYRIRAYTQWMRNASAAFFFDKRIKIGSSWANQVNTEVSVQLNDQNQTHNIKFSSKSKTPLINRPVSYTIELTNQKPLKGKTTTDNSGEVKITTPNNEKGGKIITEIGLADKTTAVKTIPIKLFNSQPDVQFFAESGTLIENLPSKIAIKAVNRSGLGENISGTITDNDGVEILNFETTHLGMGSFAITPMEGKTYKANVKFADGTNKLFDLPKPEKSGYVLSVNNTDTAKMYVKVMISADRLNQGDLNLVVQHHGHVFFLTPVSTAKQIANIVFPKNEIRSGVVQITLLNQQNIPLAERVAFINNKSEKIDINLSLPKLAFARKENISVDFIALNKTKPIQGSFSVAVTNADIITPDAESESNILTSLLLTSDLVGYIEKPNHYFFTDDLETRTKLDNLLLTRGWRKIDWKDIATPQNLAIKYPAEKSLKISGVLLKDNKPVEMGKISIFSITNGIFSADTVTDANGKFNFDNISFVEGTQFSIQALDAKERKNIKVILDEGISSMPVNILPNYNAQINTKFNALANNEYLPKENLLKQVEIIKKTNKASPQSANLNGPGNADAIFTANDFKNAISLDHFLQGRIAGVQYYQKKFFLTKNNPGMDIPIKTNKPEPMDVYINGVLAVGGDFSLDDVPINDIESIEILKSIATTFAYGTINGVIIITMKTADVNFKSNIQSPSLSLISPKGYDVPRQFYSPKYENNSENKTDLRTTVYWNPQVVTDTNGKANFSYYNTDQSGNYRMVIEGIDADGNLARNVYTYQVK